MKHLWLASMLFVSAAVLAADVSPGNFPPKGDYVYRAKVLRVVDGDTVDFEFDLGLGTLQRKQVKFRRVYAPATNRPKDAQEKANGEKVKQYLSARLSPGERVTVQTKKDAKDINGRYLAEVWDAVGNVSDGVLKFMKGNGIVSNKK